MVVALAVADGRIDGDEAWRLSQIDERHQAEKWGKDPETEARLARVRGDVLAGARLLALAQEN